jgi:hypothetical protein
MKLSIVIPAYNECAFIEEVLLRMQIEWITVRQFGHGAHSHFIAGRFMIHCHDDKGEALFVKQESIFGWAPQWWKRLGPFHIIDR